MSTGHRPSAVMRYFVPGYLLVVGAGLLVGAVLVWLYMPDDPFVVLLSGLGGLTMVLTMLGMLTVGRHG